MKTKIIVLLLLVAICACLVACGETQEPVLRGIEVDKNTLVSTYKKGDVVDIEDAKLILHYDNGDQQIPLKQATMQGSIVTNAIGTFNVTIVYQNHRCTFRYTVDPADQKVLSATLIGGKSHYEYGDTMATEGNFVLGNNTYALADCVIESVVGFDTLSAGEKQCELTVGISGEKIKVSYAYQVAAKASIQSVDYAQDEAIVVDMGTSAHDFLEMVNQIAFVIHNSDESTQEVQATAISGYSADSDKQDAVCLATVTNKSHQSAKVEVHYTVLKHYASVSVTFLPGYGNFPAQSAVTTNGKVSKPILNRPGYRLLGWAVEGTSTPFDFNTPIEMPITLVALWQIETYTITFVDGGSLADTTINYTIEQNVNLPTPTKGGADFVEFRLGSKVLPSSWTTGQYAQNMQVTVVWSYDENSIQYVLQDSLIYKASHQNPTTYTSYSVITLLDASRPGYVFGGWHLDSADGEVVTQVGDSYGNITLVATWTAETIVLTYVNTATQQSFGTRNIAPSESNILIANPSIEGYRFEGWYYDQDCNKALSKSGDKAYLPAGITESQTLYAKTTRLYTLYLDRKDDSQAIALVFGEDDDNDSDYRTTWYQASTRMGCDLVNWSYSGDKGDVTVTMTGNLPSMSCKDLCDYDGITLQATWQGHQRTLTLYNNYSDTDETGTSRLFYVPDQVELGVPAARSGYIFDGWSYARDSKSQRIQDGIIPPYSHDEDVQVYAQWKPA